MSNINTVHIPTEIFFGAGSINRFRLPAGRVLVVMGASFPVEAIKDHFAFVNTSETELAYMVKPEGEPCSSDIDSVFSGLPADLAAVVGVGGGSVMDFAKALSVLAGTGGGIADYEFGGRKMGEVLPLYLAPTTCGSGSEVSPYCVINNSETGRKFTLTHGGLRPVQAAIDPEFLRHLPGKARLATAIDAFTHCLEAVLSRQSNRVISPIAETGLKLGWNRLYQSVEKDPDTGLLADLAQLSLYGGISIAHSRTGLIHTMSVAFAEFCDMPHGLLNARLLRFALAHNMPGYDGLLKELFAVFSGENVDTDKEAYNRLTGWLDGLIGPGGLPSEHEIRERVPSIVKRMLQDGGLPGVSHGVINAESLTSLIESVADASG